MTYKSRITTAIATGAVLVYALAPLALADTVTVSDNGALSNSAVNVTNSSNTVVKQTNNSNISNNINSNASTGGNSSNFNTGGNTTISTGNAKSTVTVNNASNLNQASVPSVSNTPTTVTVSGNGKDSSNNVSTTNANNVFLDQTNEANYNNDVNANATTGNNDTSFNTGGSTVVVSGDAKTDVSVNNAANANIATVGGNNGSADPSSITVDGNSAFSQNGVVLDQDSAIVLNQANNANIKNNIDANAKTGDNKSQFNTGGSNGIESGNATNNVSVNNYANFNAADLGSDMTLSNLGANVSGNGAKSVTAVTASSDNAVFPDQTNGTGLWNNVNGGSTTGDNSLGFNTGSHHTSGDQVIYSGDGKSSTDVNNAGNVNVLDNGNSVNLPGVGNVGVNFDMNGLMTFLNGIM